MTPPSVQTSLVGDDAAGQPGLDLAREMRRRWRAGERPPAEEFLARRPELWQDAEAAVELIYEEYCIRQAAGDEPAEQVEQDLVRRFPQWAGPLRVMLDCHRRVLESDVDRPRFPAAGDRVGDFRLLGEIARGARGRVFLAKQAALADRPVVLKITPLDGGEHQSLARLQHTNIVPLYSVSDDAARNIRVLCMPYFGHTTLASLLKSLAGIPLEARTGQHILSAIDQDREPSSPSTTTAGAARQMLANVSYVQAMSWIAACLADGLHFAHERGLVHLDLKPSNVLLASDGQPMLLDFHLARGPIRPQAGLPENVGGTPPYMPPEQQAAIRLLQDGLPVEVTVDARADVFALGAMLYESLGGRLPVSPDSPLLHKLNPQVSRGLSDVIARCVAPRPEDRYPAAAALADDLRRHLTDQPLAGVRNRSLAERWRKWRRRRPTTFRTAAVVAVVLGAAAALLAGAWWHLHQRHEQAELALHDGQRQMQSLDRGEAVKTFERGLRLVEGLPFERDLRGQLHDQRTIARRLHLIDQLHQLADEVRVLYGVESTSPDRMRALASQCAQFWDKRGVIVRSLGSADADVTADLVDIALFAADVHRRVAQPDEALRLLDEAAATFGTTAVVDHELRTLGKISRTQPAPAARTAWEHCVLGRSFLAAGDLSRAAAELDAARKLDPAGRWSNFYYGLCAHRMGQDEDAVAAFSICVGTAPNVAGHHYNRALAYAALGRPDHALRDYDRALELDPAHAASALNRGMLYFQEKRYDQAIADLSLALKNGADAATVHYDLALVHMAAGQPARAAEHARLALEKEPTHPSARRLLDSIQHKLSGR